MKLKIIIFMLALGLSCSCSTKNSHNSLEDGLVAYFPFNGNAIDESKSNNSGIVSGATLTTDRFDNPDHAYYFNGVSDYIYLPTSSNFIGMNNYTISLWVKPAKIPDKGGGMIYGIGTALSVQVQELTYQPSKSLFAGSYNLGGDPRQSYSKSCCVEPDKWVFVAVSRNSAYINLFIDGSLIAPQSSSITNSQSAYYGPEPYNVIFGGRSNKDLNYFFNGTIDEVRIYNRVLTKNEISELKNLNQ